MVLQMGFNFLSKPPTISLTHACSYFNDNLLCLAHGFKVHCFLKVPSSRILTKSFSQPQWRLVVETPRVGITG